MNVPDDFAPGLRTSSGLPLPGRRWTSSRVGSAGNMDWTVSPLLIWLAFAVGIALSVGAAIVESLELRDRWRDHR